MDLLSRTNVHLVASRVEDGSRGARRRRYPVDNIKHIHKLHAYRNSKHNVLNTAIHDVLNTAYNSKSVVLLLTIFRWTTR